MSYLPRFLGVYPSKTDAVSYYRSVGVFPYVREMDYNILRDPISWDILIDKDIVFINRPFAGNFPQAVKVIKSNNKQLWLDYDDNFLNIPETNPAYAFYDKSEDREKFIEMLDSANMVTVSTESLAKYLYSVTTKCKPLVIPNAFNDYLFDFSYDISNNKVINWRGSNTHNSDFESVINEYLDTVEANPDWKFTFIGKLGYHLKNMKVTIKDPVTKKESWQENPFKKYVKGRSFSNIEAIDEMDIIDYFHNIKLLSPRIQVVPLENSMFNYNKSNIAWIEGTYAGAVTIAPNLPEFNKPGVLTYNSPQEFKKILQECIDGKYDLRSLYDQSFLYIKENLLLSKVNEIRKQVVNMLYAKVKK